MNFVLSSVLCAGLYNCFSDARQSASQELSEDSVRTPRDNAMRLVVLLFTVLAFGASLQSCASSGSDDYYAYSNHPRASHARVWGASQQRTVLREESVVNREPVRTGSSDSVADPDNTLSADAGSDQTFDTENEQSASDYYYANTYTSVFSPGWSSYNTAWQMSPYRRGVYASPWNSWGAYYDPFCPTPYFSFGWSSMHPYYGSHFAGFGWRSSYGWNGWNSWYGWNGYNPFYSYAHRPWYVARHYPEYWPGARYAQHPRGIGAGRSTSPVATRNTAGHPLIAPRSDGQGLGHERSVERPLGMQRAQSSPFDNPNTGSTRSIRSDRSFNYPSTRSFDRKWNTTRSGGGASGGVLGRSDFGGAAPARSSFGTSGASTTHFQGSAPRGGGSSSFTPHSSSGGGGHRR